MKARMPKWVVVVGWVALIWCTLAVVLAAAWALWYPRHGWHDGDE